MIYRVDYENDQTVRNAAVSKLDLVCESDALIGLIGSFFFGGLVVSTVTVSFIADYNGRRPAVAIGLAI